MLKQIQKFSPLTLIVFLVICHITLYFSFRLVLFYFVEPQIVDRSSILDALYVGLKFDGRYAVFTVLPLSLLLLFPALERKIYAQKSILRPILCFLQTCTFGVLAFSHIVDLGVYFYLQQRLDMSLMDFIENPAISALMVWQSYPVIWISLAFLVILLFYFRFWNGILKRQQHRPILKKVAWRNSHFLGTHFLGEIKRVLSFKDVSAFSVATALRIFSCIFLFIVGYGQISSNLFPLRWSNAYLSADKNIPLIAIHPVQNLYDTTQISQVVDPHFPSVLDAFPRMATYLGLEQTEIEKQVAKFKNIDLSKSNAKLPSLEFTRYVKPEEQKNTQTEAKSTQMEQKKPLNVVLLMMESLTTPRSSLPHGKPSIDGYTGVGSLPPELDLDATPFLAELMDEALYFPNFYANARTTARGIFSTVTGIPDVNFNGGTSSRNPRVVDQQVIFNEFKDYQKYYLIGGNANWANIRGVLQTNIQDLHLLEESYWEAPNVDVWGISDLALMREAVTLFNESKKPFIAFIQTAGFHRPYTIPDDNEGFEFAPSPSQEAIDYWGFENEAEYQSLRFADHALRRFFARAKEEPWFEDTVFVIFGDHGIVKTSHNMISGYLDLSLQAWHIPVFIYSPKRLITGINHALHSQVDIFPTLAYMAEIEHKNTTLGRNMLEKINGFYVPKEFSTKATPEEINAYTSIDEFSANFAYDKEKDIALENRVYVAQSEHHTMLLLDDYIYSLHRDDSQKNKLYNVVQASLDEQNLPTILDFSAKNKVKIPKNLLQNQPELAKELHEKTLDFYHSAKYLLQNNKK